MDFVSAWIAAHIAAATALGKPLLIEEFGKVVAADNAATDDSERNPYYAAVYKARPHRPPARPPAPRARGRSQCCACRTPCCV